MWADNRSSSSRTSALPTSSATSWAKRSSDSEGTRPSSSASCASKRARTVPICARARSVARPQRPFDLRHVTFDDPGQRLALGRARRDQRLQRLVERRLNLPVQEGERLFRLRAGILFLDHAAHPQQPIRGRSGRPGRPAHFVDQGRQLCQQGAVDGERLGAAFARDSEGERDVAALHLAADGDPGRIFQPVEAGRHPAPDLEVPPVYAARFPDPAPPIIRSLRPGVSRHACDQFCPLPCSWAL
jgi:hypothetical protein